LKETESEASTGREVSAEDEDAGEERRIDALSS
jgi:hypothetical protein